MSRKQPFGSSYNTAWFVSNCNATSGATRRWQYGKSLIDAGLKLYGEGSCFQNKTTRNFGQSKRFDSFPTDTLKFYLAFENAYHCTDYISEKFWRNAFQANLIPIVFGPHRDDVKGVAPPNSYIHAEDFETPAELVKYIDYLDSNDTAYLEYHQWRTIYPPGKQSVWDTLHHLGNEVRSYCELCRLIREMRQRQEHQSYKSIMKFWRLDVHPECREGVNFPEYQTKIIQNRIKL